MKTKLTTQRIVAIILAVISIALMVTSVFGYSNRTSEEARKMLADMTVRSLLVNTGEGAVEAMVKIAVEKARVKAKEDGLSMSQRRDAADKAEKDARANLSYQSVDYSTVDNAPILAAASALKEVQVEYYNKVIEEKELFAEQQQLIAPVEEEIETQETLSIEGEVAEPVSIHEEVDMSTFVQSAEADALQAKVDAEYENLTTVLMNVYPEMDNESMNSLKQTLLDLNYQSGENFESRFDRLVKYNTNNVDIKTTLMRNAKNLLLMGIFLLLLAIVVWFYNSLVKSLGVPRIIIGMFFIILCLGALALNLNLRTLLSDSLVRMGMNSILVLAMLPGIQAGISLNLGLPIGIIGGLLGGLMCIEYGFSGWFGFAFAIVVGIAISLVLGYLYALLLNRLKGSEMAVTTYVGFSIVSLMCIAWLVLPFNSPIMKWPMGNGLRTTINLTPSYRHLLNNFLSFKLFGITIPTGLLLFMILACLLMWLFSRSKTGIAMQAVGNNPRFAEATGISVNKMRIIGTVLSTILGAVGIIVYTQSYGFMQLYTAPRQMGFVAASAILIGGASTQRAKISHVLIGTFLFQGVLTLGMPVANELVPQSTISETMRILISNGIILYALTKAGGKGNEQFKET